MSHFDDAAKTWDLNPEHNRRAQAVYEAITGKISLDQNSRCLDFGCGTGILSFYFQSHVTSILCADSSMEMIKNTQEKIDDARISNMSTVHITSPADLLSINKEFDCIYSMMTLHHVVELERVLEIFFKLLRPHGYLCIADLSAEDGSFHQHLDSFEGHYGFDPDTLSGQLKKIGFSHISHEVCYTIIRNNESGAKKHFPLFLLVAEK